MGRYILHQGDSLCTITVEESGGCVRISFDWMRTDPLSNCEKAFFLSSFAENAVGVFMERCYEYQLLPYSWPLYCLMNSDHVFRGLMDGSVTSFEKWKSSWALSWAVVWLCLDKQSEFSFPQSTGHTEWYVEDPSRFQQRMLLDYSGKAPNALFQM